MSDIRYPAIPEPTPDIGALLNTVRQLKEAVELMTGQRGAEHSFANQTKTLQRQLGNSVAKFSQQIHVQSTNTTALAEQITSVEATANAAEVLGGQATASGEIKFQAKAGPAGSTASYGLYLTAGDKFAGFEVIADTGGDAAINFTAEHLRFSNSGTSEQVFEYDGVDNVFRFFVPVEMLTEDIALGAVTSAASGFADVGAGVNLSVPITTIAGSSVFVIASVYDPAFNSLSPLIVTFPGTFRSFLLSVDGVPQEYLQSFDGVFSRNASGQFKTFMNPTTLGIKIPLTAGSHTFTLNNSTSFNLRMSMIVLELKR